MIVVEENISLKDFTTLRAGGAARFFTRVKNAEEVREAVELARERGLEFFLLGGGSNTLVPDEGFSGLVIKMEMKGREFSPAFGEKIGEKKWQAVAAAGENWDDFVRETVARNLAGLENLSLIPGTVGAAPVQNIGAYGSEAKETIEWVETFDTREMRLRSFYASSGECAFGYRDSIFKREAPRFIITRVSFLLAENGMPRIGYKDVKEYLAQKNIRVPTVREVREAVIAIRTAKLPDPAALPNAGSFFKNPIVSFEKAQELAAHFPEIPIFKNPDGSAKIPAAFLIDKVCGLKGFRSKSGAVGTHEKQAVAIVNYGGANTSAEEILRFARYLAECVKEKTGIDLEREVQVPSFAKVKISKK